MMRDMINLPKTHLECIRALGAPDENTALLALKFPKHIEKDVEPLLDLIIPIWTQSLKRVLVMDLTELIEDKARGQDAPKMPIAQAVQELIITVGDVGRLDCVIQPK